jgi:AraC-like DNA-binding protein
MLTSQPVSLTVPDDGAYFAESVHTREFAMPQRADPFHKVIFVQRGRLELWSEQGRRSSVVMGPERTLLAVPAGLRHRLLDHEPSVILVLGLGDDFLRRDRDMWAIWQRLLVHPVSGRMMEGGFAGWWRRAVLEQTLQGPGYGVTVRAMAMQVLVAADRHVARPLSDSTAERVRRVQRRVQETFFEDWTIDRAAQRAGLSRRQFTLRFKAITGDTFVAHLNALRLAHAERLLRSRGHSVTGAAFSAGFEDLSHFYRLFRSRHGMPPRRWLATQTSAQ